MQQNKTPHLLSPAGSYDALTAAVSGGADEVYFGAGEFHARQGAKNFTDDEFRDALRLCRTFGVKSNITVNTLCYDREFEDALRFIERAANLGADCFIVQDMGLAALIRKEMPSLEIHASTQCACHNREGAELLHRVGFSRIVLARELSQSSIRAISENAPYETEIFAHGALCVCHSGQCLFSSIVGGRSGNRGMCAQPCRMEYELFPPEHERQKKRGFPLSLKDLCLAEHIPELCSLGVDVLKIEGRMKSPAYVYLVTKLYKTLLAEKRNATSYEMRALSDLFSRNGFTDRYFTDAIRKSNISMYGVRSENDKRRTAAVEAETQIPVPKREIFAEMHATAGEIPTLVLHDGCRSVSVCGNTPLAVADNAPATRESIVKNLLKTRNTPYALREENVVCEPSGHCFVPQSLVNDLRRRACELLSDKATFVSPVSRSDSGYVCRRLGEQKKSLSIRLYSTDPNTFEKDIKGGLPIDLPIESVVFPLHAFSEHAEKASILAQCRRIGVALPRVITPSEAPIVLRLLENAKTVGAAFCEVSNIGHIDLARRAQLEIYGGIGLNITNSESASFYRALGLRSLVLSPECKLAAVRDMQKKDDTRYCVCAYGRLPLMTLESCLVRGNGNECEKRPDGSVCATLRDRMHMEFPVVSQKRADALYPCRNLIYNSVITDLRAKKELYTSGIDVLCVALSEKALLF